MMRLILLGVWFVVFKIINFKNSLSVYKNIIHEYKFRNKLFQNYYTTQKKQ